MVTGGIHLLPCNLVRIWLGLDQTPEAKNGDITMEKTTKEEYYIRVGPLLMDILKDQRERIRDATYDVADSSYWEAGEILAKKLKGSI